VDDGPLASERKLVANMKKAILVTAGAAVQKLMMKIEGEQEILMHLADMAIEVFNSESVLLRVMKLSETVGEKEMKDYHHIIHTYIYDAADKVNKHGKDAVNAF